MIQAWLVFLGACALIAHQIWRDRRTFPAFEALRDTASRQRAFRKWTLTSFIRYGVLGVAGLMLMDATPALWQLPANMEASLAGLCDATGISRRDVTLFGLSVAGVVTLGIFAGGAAGFFLKAGDIPQHGVGALLARNRQEAWSASLISINAGLVEEIFFRAMLFVAIYHITGSVLTGMLGSTALFAVAHAYQGLAGILSSGLIGALFMVIYAATGALWLVILLHALLDLRGLVFLPWSLGWLSPEKETLS